MWAHSGLIQVNSLRTFVCALSVVGGLMARLVVFSASRSSYRGQMQRQRRAWFSGLWSAALDPPRIPDLAMNTS